MFGFSVFVSCGQTTVQATSTKRGQSLHTLRSHGILFLYLVIFPSGYHIFLCAAQNDNIPLRILHRMPDTYTTCVCVCACCGRKTYLLVTSLLFRMRPDKSAAQYVWSHVSYFPVAKFCFSSSVEEIWLFREKWYRKVKCMRCRLVG